MSDIGGPSSPLVRSRSSKDLLKIKQQSKKNSYKYNNEGMSFDSVDPNTMVESSLLQDLDIILHKKLQMNSSFDQQGLSSSTGKSPSTANVTFPINDEDMEEEEENELLEATGEDDEHEFTNVDEIDGPISPSASCKLLNDLPKNATPPKNTNGGYMNKIKYSKEELNMQPVDENLPIDEDYKKQLDQRAEEISSGFVFHTLSKPTLEWNLKAFYGLPDELSEWFDMKDYTILDKSQEAFEEHFISRRFIEDEDYASECIATVEQEILEDISNTNSLLCFCYIAFGNYDKMDNVEAHLNTVRRNCVLLSKKALGAIINVFKQHAVSCRDDKTGLVQSNKLLSYSATIFYFVVCACIDVRDSKKDNFDDVIDTIEEAEVLEFITYYIESWRWHSRLSMRIRNMIMLLFKLLTLQFGDETYYRTVKAAVHSLHGIESLNKSPERLTVSPLEYEAFRVDVSSRFPVMELLESKMPKDFDNPNSLSQFLEIPRPKAHNSVKQALAEPQIHIVTPVPSPPDSPVSRHTPKARKSFQTNLGYPSLYPANGDDDIDELENRMELQLSLGENCNLPYNIREAAEIIEKNVEIKLSTKQLWYERRRFMIQERGWNDSGDVQEDPYDYSNCEDLSDDLKAMRRVANYYKKCLPSLNSLIYVLLQTIESGITNHDFFLKDLSSDMSIDLLTPQLEIGRAKEILLRSSTGVIYTMLQWFKLCHILKFEYLSSLLHDSKITDVFIPLLSKFTYNYTERIYKKTAVVAHSFVMKCSAGNRLYSQSYEKQLPEIGGKTADIDIRMLSSEVYMLEVLSKVIGKKTYRLKELPLSIGTLFSKLYQVFNLDIYHPILKLVRELTPFKNKRWKSEHVELISGVYLYEKLSLVDNWVTGKDISSEMHDAYGHEIALRAMLQFYNFSHYRIPMEKCGYTEKPNKSFFSKESEILTSNY